VQVLQHRRAPGEEARRSLAQPAPEKRYLYTSLRFFLGISMVPDVCWNRPQTLDKLIATASRNGSRLPASTRSRVTCHERLPGALLETACPQFA